MREAADKPAQSHLAKYAVAVRNNLACFATCSLLAIASAACTGSNRNGEHDREHTAPTSVIGRPQAANPAMSSGRSSARYVITAPDPARYAFDVSVSAPASVDVAVRIDTWYGAEFPGILVSSHQSDWCRLRARRMSASNGFLCSPPSARAPGLSLPPSRQAPPRQFASSSHSQGPSARRLLSEITTCRWTTEPVRNGRAAALRKQLDPAKRQAPS